MGDLTKSIPKPLLRVAGKTLLEHKLENLPSEIDEVVILIGYLKDQITNHLGGKHSGRKISYVVQKELLGTGHGLWQLKDILKERFLVMNGDDLYSREDMEECLKAPWSILVKEVDFLEAGGRVVLKPDGKSLSGIIEGNNHGQSRALVNTGLYVLGKEIFDFPLVQIPGREEYGLPQTLLQAANDFPIEIVRSKFWFPITEPEDLRKAEEILNAFNRKSSLTN
ncbi:MAG: bifunctional UDP-N-acetylglucosamine pyrophosphorylase / Glucosamine-1-phosphate N-acetyltransferase [Parcubacteria group bacterium Gr01-1014_107]|nr:MAG: bifunctional UDP-N-acetylglucosamine pyrophosphorylase / Glucosamine-1-phosphate N-acetyltransferase [Parcubacteria group bacterium Gr01-1014_107]